MREGSVGSWGGRELGKIRSCYYVVRYCCGYLAQNFFRIFIKFYFRIGCSRDEQGKYFFVLCVEGCFYGTLIFLFLWVVNIGEFFGIRALYSVVLEKFGDRKFGFWFLKGSIVCIEQGEIGLELFIRVVVGFGG